MYRRCFCIGEPIDATDGDTALAKLAAVLDTQIRRSPEAWFFWPELPQWIEDARVLHAVADAPIDTVPASSVAGLPDQSQ
jgi:hypothetical protein